MMKSKLLALVVLATLSLSAQAKDNGDDCNGRGSCAGGIPSSTNAIGVGVGIAGASSHATGGNAHATGGSVHSNIENSIKNTNQNLNANFVNSSNKNYNDNTNVNSNKQNQNQGQSQSTANSNNAQQNVTVQGDSTVYKAPEIPVSTAYAPPAFSTANCRIALSAGVSLMNVGGSFGGSVLDTQCDLRASAQAFAANGDQSSAEYLLCNLDTAKNLPKCQSKIAEMNSISKKEVTQQTQVSSIIK